MIISIQNLTKSYINKGRKVVLNNISFDFDNKNVYGIMGSNGAGKTTLFMCLCGFTDFNGTIKCDGIELKEYLNKKNKNFAFMTSKMKLDGETTLDENVNFFGKLNDMSKEEIISRKNKLYKLLDMKNYSNLKINTLSAGLNKKALLIITLLNDPDIIIFNEPISNLDIETKQVIINLINEIKKDKIILISSHLPSLIKQTCDKVLLLKEGKLITLNKKEIKNLNDNCAQLREEIL